MDRRAFLASGAAVVATALAGCTAEGGNGGDGTPTYDVGMTASRFDPPTLTVAPGTTVVWKNTSSHAHTVTAYDDGLPDGADYFASGDFDSQSAAQQGWIGDNGGAIYESETYRHTFEVPGTHSYFCIPHETTGMVGSVTVSPSTETTTE